jgi:hypothetical protein
MKRNLKRLIVAFIVVVILTATMTLGYSAAQADTKCSNYVMSVVQAHGIIEPLNARCEPDDRIAEIGAVPNSALILDMGKSNEIYTGPGVDFYFYERRAEFDGIYLDWVEVSVAQATQSGVPGEFYTVFVWGDQDPSNNGNIPAHYALESRNAIIRGLRLGTGIGIDIGGEPHIPYRYVRFRPYPPESIPAEADRAQVDAVELVYTREYTKPPQPTFTPSVTPDIPTVGSTETSVISTTPTSEATLPPTHTVAPSESVVPSDTPVETTPTVTEGQPSVLPSSELTATPTVATPTVATPTVATPTGAVTARPSDEPPASLTPTQEVPTATSVVPATDTPTLQPPATDTPTLQSPTMPPLPPTRPARTEVPATRTLGDGTSTLTFTTVVSTTETSAASPSPLPTSITPTSSISPTGKLPTASPITPSQFTATVSKSAPESSPTQTATPQLVTATQTNTPTLIPTAIYTPQPTPTEPAGGSNSSLVSLSDDWKSVILDTGVTLFLSAFVYLFNKYGASFSIPLVLRLALTSTLVFIAALVFTQFVITLTSIDLHDLHFLPATVSAACAACIMLFNHFWNWYDLLWINRTKEEKIREKIKQVSLANFIISRLRSAKGGRIHSINILILQRRVSEAAGRA